MRLIDKAILVVQCSVHSICTMSFHLTNLFNPVFAIIQAFAQNGSKPETRLIFKD